MRVDYEKLIVEFDPKLPDTKPNQKRFINEGRKLNLMMVMDFLEQIPANAIVPFEGVDSYRGAHEGAALLPGWDEAAHFLKELKFKVIGKQFFSYKKDELFTIHQNTPVYYADTKQFGKAVVGLQLNDDGNVEVLVTNDLV